MNNAIYLRRRRKILLAPGTQATLLPARYVATVCRNLGSLGYGLSEPLLQAMRGLTIEQLTRLYERLVVDARRLRGAHRPYRPMYPIFPAQVMAMSDVELYLNAMIHYWTDGRYLPFPEAKKRYPFLGDVPLQMIDLGSLDEFEDLFRRLVASNTSLSEQDREDVAWFIGAYKDDIGRLLPAVIRQMETAAYVGALLLQHAQHGSEMAAAYCKTPTDILRLAAAMSGGDISLAEPTRFKSFTRRERNLLLGLLEREPSATEEMLRRKPRWIRLGERLHPGELAARYPNSAESFRILRNDIPFPTFNGDVEGALAAGDVVRAVAHLTTRPGELARRLDHLLRLPGADQGSVLASFERFASRVSTPVLLQLRTYFLNRRAPRPLRVFFPKGDIAKAAAIENRLPPIDDAVTDAVAAICDRALLDRFRALPPLGRCYVDPELRNFVVPFSQRSASKSLRTTVRGSRLPLGDCTAVRFFVWWMNGKGRTDVDLSASLFDENFAFVDVVSYYNLKSKFGGCHSGDIVDAPQGASEFIDITPAAVRSNGAAYVVMSIASYTRQDFCDLPECFAGWMAREHPESGEVYAPRTVQDRLDITASATIALPLIIDVVQNQVVWCDLALRGNPRWVNNVDANLKGIQLALRSLLDIAKPNLYDLFRLHAQARGTLADSPADAEMVFSAAAGTPFQVDVIAADYMK